MPATRDDAPALTIDPPASAWPALPGPRREALTTRTREALGLPVDRAVVLSGHQTEFWHPGILAKRLAARGFADPRGAVCAWLAVDQDATDALPLRYPARRDGTLAEGRWGPTLPEEVASASLPAIADWPAPPTDAATPAIAREIESLREALVGHAGAESLGAQIEAAHDDRLAALGEPLVARFTATGLARTALFGEVLERMASDPAGCVRAYNAAVRAHPRAHLRELDATPGAEELPLWHLTPGRAREGVRADALARLDPATLAPKALLMTGLARLAACDLFIHGLGGRDYDPAMQAWLEAWLLPAMPGAALAPAVTVTATAVPTLEGPEPPGEEEVHAARALARRAQDDPSAVGDEALAARKADLVARMNAATDKGARAALFREMKALAAEHRALHAERIAALGVEADRLERASAGRGLAHDRTWPAIFLGVDGVGALRERVASALGAEG